ncbi:anthrone oxygenase family protein [Pseudomonas auratipiscis]|uniref:Anthrone oxygenase family protein n=1 Tax=Pseudomonas auratipiscis TaxID=3115853 RepID=A0AB35WV60_9PSED|nr:MULTISPECIES: anthrone oxygenase family protein [unclassified Pseudomonas]MEE1867813.1 anthrone oxygenase family protein [Pseudomonas sp. 120P]MEE1960323.1 anthrone oxygenase family protein [Pseudomonas sp. 119P]
MSVIETLLLLLILATALGCGLMGGLFFAFSNFVMKALERIPEQSAVAAMQSINQVVINRLFLALFFGTALTSIALLVWAYQRWPLPGSLCMAIGSALYLAGNVLVTLLFNVPKNQTLARLDPASSEAAAAWHRYVPSWNRWNHVRTATALAAAAWLMLALGLIRGE